MITPVSQRWRDRQTTFVPPSTRFSTAGAEVAAIADDRTARDFVVQHHYSQSYPAARRRFGLYERGALAKIRQGEQGWRYAVEQVREATGLPVFQGTPEG